MGFIHWNINPEITNVMGFSLRYYGICFAGGMMLCVFMLKRIFKIENIPPPKLDVLIAYGVVGMVAGMRLGHCLFYDPSYYFHHPLEMFLPIQLTNEGKYIFTGYQGLASHGGAVGLIISLVLYSKRTQESIINTLDLMAVVAPLGSCFIRLGNLMNSEMIGFPTRLPWAFIFEREDNLPRHPAQLYEAFAYASIFLLMIFLYKTNRATLQNGALFGLSISLIFIARFFIEFLKVRQVAFEEQMFLDMGQLLSIPFILIGIGFTFYGLAKTKRDNQKLDSMLL